MRAATKKKTAFAKKIRAKVTFGGSLAVEQLVSLTAELQKLRHHPPLTRRAGGKYEGDILGFVKGLRLSARVFISFESICQGLITKSVGATC
jgi:hypothetical protein